MPKLVGTFNNLIPIIVLLLVVTVLVASDLIKSDTQVTNWARWGLLAAASLFIYLRPLKESDYVPNTNDRHTAAQLNALIASLNGGVVIPELAFLPARNGHDNPHWYTMAFYCAEWSGRPMNMPLALRATRARWVFLHSRDVGGFASFVRQKGRLARRLPNSEIVRMLTGAYIRLDELWEVPNNAS